MPKLTPEVAERECYHCGATEVEFTSELWAAPWCDGADKDETQLLSITLCKDREACTKRRGWEWAGL